MWTLWYNLLPGKMKLKSSMKVVLIEKVFFLLALALIWCCIISSTAGIKVEDAPKRKSKGEKLKSILTLLFDTQKLSWKSKDFQSRVWQIYAIDKLPKIHVNRI